MIRIYVADDHPLFREGVINLLNSTDDLQVIGQAGDTAVARREIVAKEPDVVIMDISLGTKSGIDLGRQLRQTGIDFKLLIVLLERARVVLSREQLLDLTAGRSAGPLDRTIDNQISRLRRKIEPDILQPKIIATVRNGGYCLSADVEVLG